MLCHSDIPPLSDQDLATVRHLLATHSLWGRLPPALERLLRHQRQREFQQVTRTMGPMTYPLFALIALIGALQFPEAAFTPGWDATVFWGFLGFITVAITVGYVLALHPMLRGHYLLLILGNGSLMLAAPLAASMLLSLPLMRQEMSYVAMFFISAVIGVLRAPLAVSALTCALGLLLAVVLTLALGVTPPWLLLGIYVGAAAGVSLLIAFIMGRLERLGFLRGVLLEHESAEIARLNAKLEQLACQDQLSGLANRRHLNEMLQAEWERAQRHYSALALLFIDVDHFKPYNDRYGHAAGDQALAAVASALQRSLLRPADLAARYGGEEFVILLPETDLEGAREVAQRALTQVAALRLTHADTLSGVLSISIGLTVKRPGDRGPQDLLERADRALYAAKAAGRGRVREALPATHSERLG